VSGSDASRPVVVVLDGDLEIPIRRQPDLELVDGLARLQLAARRRGSTIRLRNPCRHLLELLELVGLALPLELGREAEGLEELGVDEVVEPDDHPV
jgi:hypothetical protein